jgi:hypothetical protein
MATQVTQEQVRWQDLKVRSELDIVLEIAQKEGWKDCEVFGAGDMIAEPQESKGWKLIPADLYEASIPPQAVERLYRIINAGIRVRGVIIADDKRRTEPVPAPAPAQLEAPRMAPLSAPALPAEPQPVPLPTPARPVEPQPVPQPAPARREASQSGVSSDLENIGKVLFGLFCVGAVIALGVGAVSVIALIARTFPLLLVGLFILMVAGPGLGFDPKLVILVDDGTGGTTWVSLFTWYD